MSKSRSHRQKQTCKRKAGKVGSFYGIERKKIVSAKPPKISLGGPAIDLIGPHVSVGRIPRRD